MRTWHLYKLYDEHLRLLYVGVSENVGERVRIHQLSHTAWAAEIAGYTAVPIGGMHEAFAQERDEIVRLAPKWNSTHRRNLSISAADQSKLTAKERWERWYSTFAMKEWFSFAFSVNDFDRQVEVPIFCLGDYGASPEMRSFEWASLDGRSIVTVQPGKFGRATQFDKDVLTFIVSERHRDMRSGRPSSHCDMHRIDVHRFVMSVRKAAKPVDYRRLIQSLERLQSTIVTHSNATGGQELNFSLVESWEVSESSIDGLPLSIDVRLSKWLLDQIPQGLFPITRDYFGTKSAIIRRLYETARANCSSHVTWCVTYGELLDIMAIQEAEEMWVARRLSGAYRGDTLPGFYLKMDTTSDLIRIYPKRTKMDPAGHLPFVW